MLLSRQLLRSAFCSVPDYVHTSEHLSSWASRDAELGDVRSVFLDTPSAGALIRDHKHALNAMCSTAAV